MRVFLTWVVFVGWLVSLSWTARAEKPGSWCRLADPGETELRRVQQKISNADIGNLSCPLPADPTTLPDEIVLPMPCGQALVLRKVRLPLQNILDQKEVYLGDVEAGDTSTGGFHRVIAGPWHSVISGSLATPNSEAVRSYYIGKYEVSSLQFSIFRAGLLDPGAEQKPGACAAIEQAAGELVGTRILPATDMTWFDAIGFTDALTRYLVSLDKALIDRHRPPKALPWVEATPAYLRLPTEVEWEYAARGGIADKSAQQEKGYKVADEGQPPRDPLSIEEIASINTPGAPAPAGSSVQYMGRKKPNVFGLYDMLGNADEMTFDLFHPVGPTQERLALSGGIVLRGGNATDPAETIGVGMRRELPLYRLDGAAHSAATGFRVVLTGSLLVNKRNENFEELVGNPGLDNALASAYSAGLTPTGIGAQQRLQINDELAALRRDNDDQHFGTAVLNKRLDALQAQVDRANATINERDRQNRRQSFDNLVGLALGYNALWIRTSLGPVILKPLREELERMPATSPDRPARVQLLAEREKDLLRLQATKDQAFRRYFNGLAQIAQDGSAAMEAVIADATPDAQTQYDKDYKRAFHAVCAHARELSSGGGTPSQTQMDRWKRDLEEGFKAL